MSRMRSIFSSLWFASTPWIWMQLLARRGRDRLGVGVGGGEAGLDALGHDQLGLARRARSTISASGTTRTTWPAHEQVALAAPGGDAEVGVARLAGSVHDAAHHRDLQRDVARLERGHAPRARP